MRILEHAVYRGPHLYSATPMVRFMLDLNDLEALPTNLLPGFTENLLGVLPTLRHHGCSRRREGGLIERMNEGTWIGHVVEHVALELQCLAGSRVSRGKTRSVPGATGVYNVMYAYRIEAAGLAAGRLALELVSDLLPPEHRSLEGIDVLHHALPAAADGREQVRGLDALAEIVRRGSLGPTTQSIVDEARRRGIPYERLGEHSLIRLGQGTHQRLLRASITGLTSQIGVDNAGDKALAKSLLSAAGLPVPYGAVVNTEERAVAAAARFSGPGVTKPLDGNHGRGVTLDLVSEEDVRRGFATAAAYSRKVIVEEQVAGRDYRALVIGGKLAAVAERVPACVMGDGIRTVSELIDQLNADPRRGQGHEKAMTRVVVDEALLLSLARQGLELTATPLAGEIVLLREVANLWAGGEAIDRTDLIHLENRAIVERAARVIGLGRVSQ